MIWKKKTDFEANFGQKEHTQTQEHLVLRPCNISHGLSGETETLKQGPAVAYRQINVRQAGKREEHRHVELPKFQPALTVQKKPSPSYTYMHRHEIQ